MTYRKIWRQEVYEKIIIYDFLQAEIKTVHIIKITVANI